MSGASAAHSAFACSVVEPAQLQFTCWLESTGELPGKAVQADLMKTICTELSQIDRASLLQRQITRTSPWSPPSMHTAGKPDYVLVKDSWITWTEAQSQKVETSTPSIDQLVNSALTEAVQAHPGQLASPTANWSRSSTNIKKSTVTTCQGKGGTTVSQKYPGFGACLRWIRQQPRSE